MPASNSPAARVSAVAAEAVVEGEFTRVSSRYAGVGRYHASATVTEALARQIQTLRSSCAVADPEPGLGMARHAQFTVDTGVQVFFCDPKTP